MHSKEYAAAVAELDIDAVKDSRMRQSSADRHQIYAMPTLTTYCCFTQPLLAACVAKLP